MDRAGGPVDSDNFGRVAITPPHALDQIRQSLERCQGTSYIPCGIPADNGFQVADLCEIHRQDCANRERPHNGHVHCGKIDGKVEVAFVGGNLSLRQSGPFSRVYAAARASVSRHARSCEENAI
jgi:hypothetical protein